MRTILAATALLVFSFLSVAQGIPSWARKNYHVLRDGNQLYSSCQAYQQDVHISGDNVRIRDNASTGVFPAGECWGYILGVVDSIPAGEGFNPDESVRASQYVDVVFDYLRDHPEQRHYGAYFLVRTALTDAFPESTKR